VTNAELDGTGIAVLPFLDLSPERDQEYLADGIAEEILSGIAQVEGLRVVARTSSFAFKGDNVPMNEIARQLGVANLLEGSVRRSGDQVRIAVRLIHGETGFRIWSAVFDRGVEDLLAVQDEIARSAVSALEPALLGERPLLVRTETENPAAYGLYLQGRHFWNMRTEAGLLAAIDRFEAAIASDPGFAAAHAGLASAYDLLSEYGRMPPREAFARATAAAERALSLDSTRAEAHVVMGSLKDRQRDRAGAEAAYLRGIALNPNDATARHWYAVLLAITGRPEMALLEIRRAQALDPVSRVIGSTHAAILYWDGRDEEAIAEWRRTLELDPHFAPAHWWIALPLLRKGLSEEAMTGLRRAVELTDGNPGALAALAHGHAASGEPEEARRILDELERLPPGLFVPPARLALAYAALGDLELGLELLERAAAIGDPWLELVLLTPELSALRSHPRLIRLASGIGMHLPA
jgi:adenylate cyclase